MIIVFNEEVPILLLLFDALVVDVPIPTLPLVVDVPIPTLLRGDVPIPTLPLVVDVPIPIDIK